MQNASLAKQTISVSGKILVPVYLEGKQFFPRYVCDFRS